MRKNLGVSVLGWFEDQSETPDETLTIPTELGELSAEEVEELSGKAREAFALAYGDGTAVSDEELSTLSELADGIERLQAEVKSRADKLAGNKDKAAELASRVTLDVNVDDDGNAEGTAEVETDDEEENPDGEASAETEELAAKPVTVNVGRLRGKAPVTPPAPEVEKFEAVRDGNGKVTDLSGLANLIDDDAGRFRQSEYQSARRTGTHLRQQNRIGTISKPIEEDFSIKSNDPSEAARVFALAADERNTPQKSLVASGGWCAPSETIYDIVPGLETTDGLLSVPEVNIGRGGIRFTKGVDFVDVFANSGFSFTEEDDIAGNYAVDEEGNPTAGDKPCYKVDCPEFEEVRLDVAGLCVTAGLLQSRGYPEVIQDTIAKAVVAHAHRMNVQRIGAIIAGSTAITMPSAQVGALAPILTSIDLQVAHFRAQHRMNRSATLEAVFPEWVYGAVRTDLARSLGVDMYSVPDARVNQWFTERNVAPQFVYDWQDIGQTDAAAFTEWPETIQFALYAAGTWTGGTNSVITLDTVYDSLQLAQNDYTALWTEEGWLMAKRRHDSRIVEVPIAPTGARAYPVEIAANGTGNGTGA